MFIGKLYNLFLAYLDAKLGNTTPFALPLKIHIELNDFCNLKCLMCGRHNDNIPKNTGEFSIDLLNKLSPLLKKAIYVGLAGNGEPFLHSRIFEMISYIIKHGTTPAIITNATLLTPQVSDRLINMGPVLLQASIDSGVPEIYEKIRIGASFKKVRDNLLYLKKMKDKNNSSFPVVTIIACLMKDTIERIEKLVDFANEISAPEISFQNILPYNKEMINSLIESNKAGEEVVDSLRKYADKFNIKLNYIPMGFNILNSSESGEKRKCSFTCPNINDLLHIELSGKVRYCCFWSGEKLGDITTEDPIKIWKSKKYANLRKKLKLGKIPEYCQNCHLLKFTDKNEQYKNITDLIKSVIKNNKYFKNIK